MFLKSAYCNRHLACVTQADNLGLMVETPRHKTPPG